MKVYIVVDCCSGEHYSVDDPTILFVSDNFKKALDFMQDEIDNWEDGMVNYDSNTQTVDANKNEMIYECVDFGEDTHRVIKLVEKEVE